MSPSEKHQGIDVEGSEIKGAKSTHGASHEADERGEQRHALVHGLEQVIEEQRHRDIAGGRDEVGYKPAAKRAIQVQVAA